MEVCPLLFPTTQSLFSQPPCISEYRWAGEERKWNLALSVNKDTLTTRVGTYGLRLLKDLECGSQYVKVYKKFKSSSSAI